MGNMDGVDVKKTNFQTTASITDVSMGQIPFKNYYKQHHDGCLIGPGVNLNNCNVFASIKDFDTPTTGTVQPSNNPISLEDVVMTYGSVANMTFHCVKNADFTGSVFQNCHIKGSIHGTKFINIKANGTKADRSDGLRITPDIA